MSPNLHPRAGALCSKSTLLDLLAGRKTSGRLDPGSAILLNGQLPTAATLRRDGATSRRLASPAQRQHCPAAGSTPLGTSHAGRQTASCPIPLLDCSGEAADADLCCHFAPIPESVSAPVTASAVGYVEQKETLLPLLTPREMLLYTAELKHPRGRPLEAKCRLVDELIEQ